MKKETKKIAALYGMEHGKSHPIPAHEGGRNELTVLTDAQGTKTVLRVSRLDDRTLNDYLAEAEFVHYLAEHGAAVADVLPSLAGRPVETVQEEGRTVYASLFQCAPGMLIADNGYRYREGAPLSEYFFNTGKTLGRIHALAKEYTPVHRRFDYHDTYNRDTVDALIPDTFGELKQAIFRRLESFRALPRDDARYGLVHFDFSDGNYHVNMETGALTVFDFDNAQYCWYMFDLANLWTHGVGWIAWEPDAEKRRAFMEQYFRTVLEGYRTETDLPEDMEEKLTLFIDMVLVENVVDEFQCCARAGEPVDYEDIEDAAEALIHDLPYEGFFED